MDSRSRPQVDDPNKRCAGANRGAAEGDVVCHDDPTLAGCVFEHMNVRMANKMLVPCGAYIATTRPKSYHDIGSDVLVCQQREVERLHALIFSAQVCSPFNASAA